VRSMVVPVSSVALACSLKHRKSDSSFRPSYQDKPSGVYSVSIHILECRAWDCAELPSVAQGGRCTCSVSTCSNCKLAAEDKPIRPSRMPVALADNGSSVDDLWLHSSRCSISWVQSDITKGRQCCTTGENGRGFQKYDHTHNFWTLSVRFPNASYSTSLFPRVNND
jgi:hypothetical protein